MKKTILTLMLIVSVSFTSILLSSQHAAAQSQGFTVGATIGLGLPLGDFGDGVGLGFGFTASGRYLVNENVGVGINVGFSSFGAKDNDGVKESVVPITVAGEYKFGDGALKPYVGAELGIGILSATATFQDPFTGTSSSETASNTGFFFAPTVGIQYALSDNLNFIGDIKYNYVTASGGSVSYIGINAGINFAFGK